MKTVAHFCILGVLSSCSGPSTNLAAEMCPTVTQGSESDRVQLIGMLTKQGINYSDAAGYIGNYFRLRHKDGPSDEEVCAAVLSSDKTKIEKIESDHRQQELARSKGSEERAKALELQADALDRQADAMTH